MKNPISKVSTDTLKRYCKQNGFTFLEVSAKENKNIDSAFKLIAEKAAEYSNLLNSSENQVRNSIRLTRPTKIDSGSGCCE